MSATVLEGKTRDELLALARSYNWWHSIDLGGYVTPGNVGRWPLIEKAFDQVDFKGKKVLDIGCWDGLWSFEAEKRGAREVHSVDYVSLRSWSEQPTYQLAHKLLGSKARYYPNLSVYDIGRLGVTDFDVVVYCGIYYHLLEPLRAFTALREVMTEGGLMIVEGPAIESERVFATFSARTWFAEDPTNWWVPSVPCLREWVDCTFFDVVTEFSGNRDISGLPAASPGPAPAGAGGLWGRLRALRRAATSATPAPPAEREDRISLVARATSTTERVARRAKEQRLPSLRGKVTPAEMAAFGQAATRFHAARPWTRVAAERTIQVDSPRIGEPGFLTLFGDGAERGILIYFQRPGLTMTRQGSLLGGELTWAPFAGVFFWPEADLPPDEAEAYRAEGHVTGEGLLPYAVFNEGHGYRSPDPARALRRPAARELALIAECLRALPAFIERHGTSESASEEFAAAQGGSPLTLSWVVEGAREL
jgi:tRNA (mo5U34)-methyltransferase